MTAARLRINSLPTLPTTSPTCLLAGWFRPIFDGLSTNLLSDLGASGIVVNHYGAARQFSPATVPVYKLIGFDAAGAEVFVGNVIGDGSINAINAWRSFALSINTTTQTVQLMENRVLLDTSGIAWNSSNPIGFHPSTDPWLIGPVFGPLTEPISLPLRLYDFRFGAGEGFFDLSSAANANKLFTPANRPVNWGPDGSLVTGSQPAVYLHEIGGVPASYAANLGSGGSFTILDGPLLPVSGP